MPDPIAPAPAGNGAPAPAAPGAAPILPSSLLPGGSPAQPIGITSDQLAQRLAEERQKGEAASRDRMLADLGFKSIDEAKAGTKAWRDLQQAQLSEQEKLQKAVADLTPRAERAAALESTLSKVLAEQVAALPEAMRKVIEANAKSPEQTAQLLEMFRASGAIDALTKGAPAAPPVPAPANTAPPAGAPKPGEAKTKFQQWQEMAANPAQGMAASVFYNLNRVEIERDRPA